MIDIANIIIVFGMTMENVKFFYISILSIILNPNNSKGL